MIKYVFTKFKSCIQMLERNTESQSLVRLCVWRGFGVPGVSLLKGEHLAIVEVKDDAPGGLHHVRTLAGSGVTKQHCFWQGSQAINQKPGYVQVTVGN